MNAPLRTINHDRRAVAIGVVGVWLLISVFGLLMAWEGSIKKEQKRVERALWQLNLWIPKGHVFPIWGHPRAAEGGPTLPHPTSRCPECLKGDGRLHVYAEYSPGGDFEPVNYSTADWKVDHGTDAFREEGPYVITYTVRGERHQELLNQKEVGGRALVLREASKEPSKIIQDIKVFRSYRIDPKELEASK